MNTAAPETKSALQIWYDYVNKLTKEDQFQLASKTLYQRIGYAKDIPENERGKARKALYNQAEKYNCHPGSGGTFRESKTPKNKTP
ncbi:hypothetical protein GCM10028807_62880 [Spirosoma daeguense]